MVPQCLGRLGPEVGRDDAAPDLTLHGWIALTLGVLGTIGLTWGLMSLAFRSHRDGWDDRVDNSLDPGREGED